MSYRRAIFPLTNGGEEIACFLCYHAYENHDLTKGLDELKRNPVSCKRPPPMALE